MLPAHSPSGPIRYAQTERVMRQRIADSEEDRKRDEQPAPWCLRSTSDAANASEANREARTAFAGQFQSLLACRAISVRAERPQRCAWPSPLGVLHGRLERHDVVVPRLAQRLAMIEKPLGDAEGDQADLAGGAGD